MKMNKQDIELPEEEKGSQPNELPTIIQQIFSPATSVGDSDDLLAGYELMEAVSPHCETSREFLFTTMINLGFKTITIHGELYWLVKNN